MGDSIKFPSQLGEVEFNDSIIKIEKSGLMGNCMTNQFKNDMNRLRLIYGLLLCTSLYCVSASYFKGEPIVSVLNTASYLVWFAYLLYTTKGKTLATEIDRETVNCVSFKRGIWGIQNSAIVVEYVDRGKAKKREFKFPDLFIWDKEKVRLLSIEICSVKNDK